MAEHVAQHVDDVLVAIGAGKLENGEVHMIYDYDLRFTRQTGWRLVNRKS